MSTYTEVYLRKGNTFALLSATGASACRSEMLSSYAPYERLCPLEATDVRAIITEYTKHLRDWEQRIKLYNKRKNTIAKFDNSIEEKLDAINELDADIEEIRQTIEEIKTELDFMELLDDIIGYSDESGVYVYVGKELPRHVTPADIQGGENLTPEQIAGPKDDDEEDDEDEN